MPSMGERRGCSRRTLSKMLRFAPMLLIFDCKQYPSPVQGLKSLLADKSGLLRCRYMCPCSISSWCDIELGDGSKTYRLRGVRAAGEAFRGALYQ